MYMHYNHVLLMYFSITTGGSASGAMEHHVALLNQSYAVLSLSYASLPVGVHHLYIPKPCAVSPAPNISDQTHQNANPDALYCFTTGTFKAAASTIQDRTNRAADIFHGILSIRNPVMASSFCMTQFSAAVVVPRPAAAAANSTASSAPMVLFNPLANPRSGSQPASQGRLKQVPVAAAKASQTSRLLLPPLQQLEGPQWVQASIVASTPSFAVNATVSLRDRSSASAISPTVCAAWILKENGRLLSTEHLHRASHNPTALCTDGELPPFLVVVTC